MLQKYLFFLFFFCTSILFSCSDTLHSIPNCSIESGIELEANGSFLHDTQTTPPFSTFKQDDQQLFRPSLASPYRLRVGKKCLAESIVAAYHFQGTNRSLLTQNEIFFVYAVQLSKCISDPKITILSSRSHPPTV